jgi:hypothetical protein
MDLKNKNINHISLNKDNDQSSFSINQRLDLNFKFIFISIVIFISLILFFFFRFLFKVYNIVLKSENHLYLEPTSREKSTSNERHIDVDKCDIPQNLPIHMPNFLGFEHFGCFGAALWRVGVSSGVRDRFVQLHERRHVVADAQRPRVARARARAGADGDGGERAQPG